MENNCKFGVIVVPGHSTAPMKNIGDYVQSLAALQFVPVKETPILLDREKLNIVKQEGVSEIKTIMNGWWMGNPNNFPPSNVIKPLYVSFHLRPRIEQAFFTPEVIEHLKAYSPIGCRDGNTVKLMQAHGIDAYFSGCLTLTLGLTFKHQKVDDSKVYFVDPYVAKFISKDIKLSVLSLFRSVYSFLLNMKKIARIAKRIKTTSNTKRGLFSLYSYATKIYSTYSNSFSLDVLENAFYYVHSISKAKHPTDEERLTIARDLLEKYSKAKFVVTSKIHCGLPCLGMGTPVILIISSGMIRTGRMDSLKDFFKKGYVENGKCELYKGDFSLNTGQKITSAYSFENYESYLSYANDLIKRCKDFIQS